MPSEKSILVQRVGILPLLCKSITGTNDYSSQDQDFTGRLLKPLWEIGYRYLALETLSSQDSELQQRGYPLRRSGYYTRDPVLSNVIREALQIGYKLIAYETERGVDGTERDYDQAKNIYDKTYAKDQEGKVLIHAGYSHIVELGDSGYEPMGYQLKQLIREDILTIDQVRMVSVDQRDKLHPYYKEVLDRFKFNEPTIFLNMDNTPIVDPISEFTVDLQIYHPPTRFEKGRPNWLKKANKVYIELPEELKTYGGHLIEAVIETESIDAIPVDRFVIDEEKQLVLSQGDYRIEIINCEGQLKSRYRLEVE